MASKQRLVGAAILLLPWPAFLLLAKGLGFVSAWMLIVTLVISAFGLTVLISPAAPRVADPAHGKPGPDEIPSASPSTEPPPAAP